LADGQRLPFLPPVRRRVLSFAGLVEQLPSLAARLVGRDRSDPAKRVSIGPPLQRPPGPYEFQDLVAALLRAVGYSTPFIAPTDPDGGTDVLAYPDPLGAQTPHVRVRVKHRPAQKATREEIAALRGIIWQDREIGLFLSTAGFTNEATREARNGSTHIELMDLQKFLDSWMDHYEKLSEEDKSQLRLRPIHFLAPD
jgi:restriction system protein